MNKKSNWEKLQRIYSIPNIPLAPAPPLPINLIQNEILPKKTKNLFNDVFGEDINILITVLDAEWSNLDQKSLSAEILSGLKIISKLSDQDCRILDSIVEGLNIESDKQLIQKIII